MNTDNMQHGQEWRGQNVEGWIATEKFDGIRAYWDGATLWTRGGKAVPIPREWKEALPAGIHLDGELFAGYGQRKKAEAFAKRGENAKDCVFKVFDAPMVGGGYAKRLASIEHGFIVQSMESATVSGIDEAAKMVRHVQYFGGEGLILRHPDLAYTPGRTDQLLKLKTWELN
jgi:DNA ligase-1